MVLRPFDCLEVDALLHHLPQGAHITQSVDMLKGGGKEGRGYTRKVSVIRYERPYVRGGR